MLVVMTANASEQEVRGVVEFLDKLGVAAQPVGGPACTTVHVANPRSGIDARQIKLLPGVERVVRLNKSYKLASREHFPNATVIQLPQASIGPDSFTVIAGPCAVENEDMAMTTAEFLMSRGVRLMRGGAFKPRTSPYSFQGLGREGLSILARVRWAGAGRLLPSMSTKSSVHGASRHAASHSSTSAVFFFTAKSKLVFVGV